MWKNQKLPRIYVKSAQKKGGGGETVASVKGKFPVTHHCGEQDKLSTITHATINSAQNSA
jgi:hypothetical protein